MSQIKTIEIGQGSMPADIRAIAEHSKAKMRQTTTWIAGLALVFLIVLYGINTIWKGIENHELLTLIGTVFGLFIGRIPQRSA